VQLQKTLVGTFALAVLLGLGAHDAEAGSRYCYPPAYNQDGDGYADLGALSPTNRLFKVEADTCPADSVIKYGDCDDDDINVHPGRSEVGYNGIDDNCRNGVDEPTFVYYAGGNKNTTSGFRIAVNLNSLAALDAASAGSLHVDIEYARLSNSANALVLRKVRVLSSECIINLALTGLAPATVYRARVALYRKLPDNSFRKLGDPDPDHVWSAWYYTITDGTIPKTHTRALMVLKGFKELSESDNGQVGYLGVERDGTRYGADEGEAWCSEFYAWVTETWLIGVSGQHYSGGLIDFFEEAGSYYPGSEIATRAAPGDYLPIDTNEDGEINHSAMFLAYDTSQASPQVWTLEGNYSNNVQVASRNFDHETRWHLVNTGLAWVLVVYDYPVLAGLGYILNSQLR
jgi:hypothetical protein